MSQNMETEQIPKLIPLPVTAVAHPKPEAG